MSLPFISSQNASAVAAQNFLKSKNVGADAYAGATNYQAWWQDPSANLLSRDALEIAVSILKIGETIASLAREIPVLGTALNVTSTVGRKFCQNLKIG
jgi:hypothetical protein